MKLNLAIEIANGFDQDSTSPTALAVDPRRHIENRIKSTLDAMGLTEWPEGASPILMKLDGTNKKVASPMSAPYSKPIWERPIGVIGALSELCPRPCGPVIEYMGSRPEGNNAFLPVGSRRGQENYAVFQRAVSSLAAVSILDNTEPDELLITRMDMVWAVRGVRVVVEPIPKHTPLSVVAGYSSYTNVLARRLLDTVIAVDGVIYIGFDGRAANKARLPLTTEEVLAVIRWARDGGARELTLCIHGPAHAKAVWEAYSQTHEGN